MIGFIREVSHVPGYIPVVGSVIGGARITVSAVAACISLLAAIVFQYREDYDSNSKAWDFAVGPCINHLVVGVIEVIPFAKIAVKISEIYRGAPDCWSFGISGT